MNDPLVDESGFPRNDIDVYQVRQARHQIICLQNDLKALMKHIEEGLHMVHAEAAAQKENPGSRKMQGMDVEGDVGGNSSGLATSTNASRRPSAMNPIAKVNVVSDGSPAQSAVRSLNT